VTAPSLVDLAHAAEQAIAAYVDAADKACVLVGCGNGNPGNVETSRLVAFRTVEALWLSRDMSMPAIRELHDMRALIGAGIVRPEWGLRVVRIAAAEQARRAGHG
jgi:hypothetical protein